MDYSLARNIYKKSKQAIGNFQLSKYIEYYIRFKAHTKYLIKSFNELSDLHFASFSYIPFAGWILPLLLRKGNLFCKHHAKQGFFLAFIFVVTAIVLNLINKFVPGEWREFRLAIVIAIYTLYLFYLIFSIFAARRVFMGKPFDLIIIKRLANLAVRFI